MSAPMVPGRLVVRWPPPVLPRRGFELVGRPVRREPTVDLGGSRADSIGPPSEGPAVTFGQWYVRRGRLSLPALGWQYVLPLGSLGFIAGITDSFRGYPPPASEGWSIWTYTGGPVSLTLVLVTLVPWVSAIVARLHDRGRSARVLWWLVVPGVGWLVVVVQTCLFVGDAGANRYGPAPDTAEPEPSMPSSR